MGKAACAAALRPGPGDCRIPATGMSGFDAGVPALHGR